MDTSPKNLIEEIIENAVSPDPVPEPEAINAPGLDPADDDLDTEADVPLNPGLPATEKPAFDPEIDQQIQEEIKSGVRDPNSISNPDAGI